ncbi:phage tail protein [Clostridia bacterium]|nr:phage tail protein [Clostridia bacterium]
MSLAEAFTPPTPQWSFDSTRAGISLAKVTNINDPDSLGRIKCKPVSENEDVTETNWCFCMSPFGGNGCGIFFFPNVDDLVMLAYLGGDVHHPVVLGSYWADAVKAPYKVDSGKNETATIKSPKGVEIKFDLQDGKEKLTLTTPSKAVIEIDDENKKITVQGDSADNALLIDWGKGEIELKAKTKLTLSAGDSKITLESSGNASVESKSKLAMKSLNVEVNADSGFKVASNGTAELKATGSMKVTATGPANLESSAVTTVKGSLVKIN